MRAVFFDTILLRFSHDLYDYLATDRRQPGVKLVTSASHNFAVFLPFASASVSRVKNCVHCDAKS